MRSSTRFLRLVGRLCLQACGCSSRIAWQHSTACVMGGIVLRKQLENSTYQAPIYHPAHATRAIDGFYEGKYLTAAIVHSCTMLHTLIIRSLLFTSLFTHLRRHEGACILLVAMLVRILAFSPLFFFFHDVSFNLSLHTQLCSKSFGILFVATRLARYFRSMHVAGSW